jgi:hypothetical protein
VAAVRLDQTRVGSYVVAAHNDTEESTAKDLLQDDSGFREKVAAMHVAGAQAAWREQGLEAFEKAWRGRQSEGFPRLRGQCVGPVQLGRGQVHHLPQGRGDPRLGREGTRGDVSRGDEENR